MPKKTTKTKTRSRRKSVELGGRVDQLNETEGTVQLSLPIAEILAGVSDAVERVTGEAGILIMKALIDEEVEQLAGERYTHDEERQARRWGREIDLDADNDRSQIFELKLGSEARPLGLFLLGFGEDEDGELYVLTSASSGPLGQDGQVFRVVPSAPEGTLFVRGDVDGNGERQLSDPINNLRFQFVGTFSPQCLDALDTDDSGEIDLSDPIFNLTAQFLGGVKIPPPSPECGVDPTQDGDADNDLGCESCPLCDQGAS